MGDAEIKAAFPAMTYKQRLVVDALIRSAVEKALAEQEARHKREVIEAKVAALMDFRVEIGNETGLDDALALYLTYLRAELAALEVGGHWPVDGDSMHLDHARAAVDARTKNVQGAILAALEVK